jgi:RHS repeat-associated protein
LLIYFMVICTSVFFGQAAQRQSPQGINIVPAGGSAPDQIDLNALTNILPIPIRHKAGRGLPFDAILQYNSGIYSNQSSAWYPASTWGWTLVTSVGGAATLSAVPSEHPCGSSNTFTIWSHLLYTDSTGVQHGFNTGADGMGASIWDESECPTNPGIYYGGYPAAASDGSGYVLNPLYNATQPYQYSQFSVTSPSGAVTVLYMSELGSENLNDFAGDQNSITDSNGNQITQSFPSSGGVQYIDSLGQIVLSGPVPYGPTSNGAYSYSNSSGTTYSYSLVYKSYNVQTAFGCSGISEYYGSGTNLLDHISLPDGREYQFTYQPTTVGSDTITGLLSQVTLPSGGTISYSNNSPCSSGSQNGSQTQTRTLTDGQGHSDMWTYATQQSVTNNFNGPQTIVNTTTITDPTGAKQILSFQPGSMVNYDPYPQRNFLTSSQTYSPSNTLLRTQTTTYTQANATGLSSYLTGPMSGTTVISSYPGPAGVSSQVLSTYNSIGLPTNISVYDFGSLGGRPGPLLMSTVSTYPSSGANSASPSSITSYDGANAITGQTNYYYDQTTPLATSGTPNHQSGMNSGNLTTVKTLVSGTKYLVKTLAYNDTGTLNSVTDTNGAITTYTYDQCGNSFLSGTSTTVQNGSGATLTTGSQWDCYGGVAISNTDVNGDTTIISSNDPWWRPITTTDWLGTTTGYTYPTNSSNTSSITKSFEDHSPSQLTLTTYDGLSRPILNQARQGPTSSTYSSIANTYSYSSLGYSMWSSTPYSGAAGSYMTSGAGNTSIQDALGNPTLSSDAGGGTTSYSYSLNDVDVSLGPAPSGENTKARQLQFNGAGQLVSVCEITSSQGSGPCGQNSSGTGFETTYTYDGTNLTAISQNVQAGLASAQNRILWYDLLGRETREDIPETGSTVFTYDVDSSGSCPGSYAGDIVKTVDNAGDIVCSTYDSLHRPLTSTVVSGPYASVTPQRNYVYDAASYSGTTMQNVRGNLAEAYTCAGSCSTKLTDLFLSLTPVISAPQVIVTRIGSRTIVTTIPGHPTGQTIADLWEATPNSAGYFHTSSLSNGNGTLASMSAVEGTTSIGIPSVTYGIDSLGRPYTATDTTNSLGLVSSTNYNDTTGTVQGITFGNGDSDSFGYDPLTNRPTSFGASIAGPSPFSVSESLAWNPNGSLGQFVSTDTGNGTYDQNCQYQADDLSRLFVANCVGTWGQTFTYDPFGNLSKSSLTGNSGMTQPYPATYLTSTGNPSQTNQVTGGTPASYDLNGNALNSGLNNFTWNAYNEPITIQGNISATYDALGRVVEVGLGGNYKQYVYNPLGNRLGIVQAGQLVQGMIPLPGGSTAVYSNGFSYFRHNDWLGSSRLATTWQHAVYAKEQYAPFGETYQEIGQDRSFTGQDQDTTSGVYDFLFRKYDSTAGRWASPDPAGWLAADLTNPQSLNRYAYVLNSPLNATDGLGLYLQCTGGYIVYGNPSLGQSGEATTGETCTDSGNSSDNGVSLQPDPDHPGAYHVAAGTIEFVDPYIDMSGEAPNFGPSMYVYSNEVNHLSTYEDPGANLMFSQAGRTGERGQTSTPDKPTKGAKPIKANGKIVGWLIPSQDGKGKPKTLEWGRANGLNENDPKWAMVGVTLAEAQAAMVGSEGAMTLWEVLGALAF